VLRIPRSADLQQVGATLVDLEQHTIAGSVTQEARVYNGRYEIVRHIANRPAEVIHFDEVHWKTAE